MLQQSVRNFCSKFVRHAIKSVRKFTGRNFNVGNFFIVHCPTSSSLVSLRSKCLFFPSFTRSQLLQACFKILRRQEPHRVNGQTHKSLPVKPVSMINPLSKDLDGGLGTILLFSWHVKIVNKHYYLLTNGWAIYTTLPSVLR